MMETDDSSSSKQPQQWIQFDKDQDEVHESPTSAAVSPLPGSNSSTSNIQSPKAAPEMPSSKKSSGSTSSGVSSARGSVTSIDRVIRNTQSLDPGTLAVSEVQIVNENQLKNPTSSFGPPVTQNDTAKNNSASTAMDNINLSETDLSNNTKNPGTDNVILNQPIRGKRFQSGEVVVTLLPVNERFPWITPAKFRPELVPEELMAPVLTLTVEEYVRTMEKLTTDMRFMIYNMSYKRILMVWITLAFIILLSFLFTFTGVELFACGVAWLILNAFAIFFCMWIKLKLNKQLEKCMASINAEMMPHNLLIGVDDRGKLSCHKVNICFIYMDSTECVKKLEKIMGENPVITESDGKTFDRESYLRNEEEFEDVEVVISGRNSVKVDKKRAKAEKLYLHYFQRWAKDYLRRRLDWVMDDRNGSIDYGSHRNPRHMPSSLCPCQYIEEHLRNKRHRESLNPCNVSLNPCHWCA